MTEQTVSVPLELLQALKDEYPLAASRVEGAIPALANLIPAPPKVGDTLTAEQVATLPVRAVVIDSDGDAWVVAFGGKAYLAMDGSREPSAPRSMYAPYHLVHLPRD